MATAKNKTQRKKPAPAKKSTQRAPSYRRVIAVCLLLIVIFGGLGRLFDVDRPAKEVLGTAALSDRQLQTLSDKAKYKSLDLRIAKLAVYKGAPLKVVKDLGTFGGAHQQIISFPVYAANLTEYGLLTLPVTSQPAGGYPVVVLCHGYVNPPRYSTQKGYLMQMEYFAQHGYAVVKPDFRGQGLSIAAGRPEGAYFSMAYNTDALSLVASIKDTSYFNKSKINFWGHSMGAYIALRASVLSPDIKAAVLVSGPVASLAEMYKDYVPPSDRSNPVAQLIKNTELTQFGTPSANPNFWANASPINFLSQTNTYFQIDVGSADKTVPPEFSGLLDAALSKANKQHQYYSYEGGDHGLGPQMALVLQRSLSIMQTKD